MPDLGPLNQRLFDLEEYYSNLRSRWVEDEAYYVGDFDVQLPEEVAKRIPATGRNAVDVPATHIVTDKPVVKRRREIHGKRAREDDDDVESWNQAFLQENEEQAETPPLHEAVKYQMLRGEAVLAGPFFSRKRWKAGEDDWLWYDCYDPANVVMEPGPRPREVFFQYDVTVAEMEQKAHVDERFRRFDRRHRRESEMLTLVEWYGFEKQDQRFCSYAAWERLAGEWVAPPSRTGYDYLPAEKVYSGFGIRSFGAKPEQVSVGMFTRQVKMLLEEEAYAMSVASAIMGSLAWERYRIPPGIDPKLISMLYDPGTVSIMPKEMDLIKQAELSAALLQWMDRIDMALEKALYAGVIGGQRPKGVSTASGLAILSGQARLKFGPPLQLLQAGVAKLLRKMAMLLANVAQFYEHSGEFTLRGRKIRVGQWNGDYTVRVNLLAEDPEERNSRVALGNTLENKLSRRRIAEEYYGVENWSEDLEEQLFESLVLGDAMRQTLEQYVQLQKTQGAEQQGPGMGGVDALGQMNAQARMMRSSRPWAPQTPALPGSPEAMAQVATSQAQPAPAGAGGGMVPFSGGM